MTIYKHTFNLELLSPKGNVVLFTLKNLEIGCAESNPPVLLGASDFLTHFDLSIRYEKQELIFTWQGWGNRPFGDLAAHVLDAMQAFLDASDTGKSVILSTTCSQSVPMPMNWRDGEVEG